MAKSLVLTIDGPGGAGKGTISRMLARHLNWHYLESGAIYRALAFAALQQDVDLTDESALVTLAHEMPLSFHCEAESYQVMLGEVSITEQLSNEACGNAASKIAIVPAVRAALVDKQRDFQQLPGLIAEGRDMGTVIFPEAQYKVYLTASVEERAKRRYNQLKEAGNNVSLEGISNEVAERDARDMNRQIAPLKPADDAIIIDCTALSIEHVFNQCLSILGKN